MYKFVNQYDCLYSKGKRDHTYTIKEEIKMCDQFSLNYW